MELKAKESWQKRETAWCGRTTVAKNVEEGELKSPAAGGRNANKKKAKQKNEISRAEMAESSHPSNYKLGGSAPEKGLNSDNYEKKREVRGDSKHCHSAQND